jgi:Pyruvate/2-oxoacid:ferredoxin oxidoreductase delta subunit
MTMKIWNDKEDARYRLASPIRQGPMLVRCYGCERLDPSNCLKWREDTLYTAVLFDGIGMADYSHRYHGVATAGAY